MAFEPKELDFRLSPFTGLTRKHWLDAARYMLEGIFRHVKSMDSPVLVPRMETEITYPNARTPEWKKKAEIFEGLARSFFIAAPLIHNDPEASAGGILLREYYKKQILRAVTPGDENYVLGYDDMEAMEKESPRASGEPIFTFQQTVETCGLVIGLWASRQEIWDTYTQEEKDRIAAFLSPYAHKNTVPHNWRLFNMLDLAFLHMNGYPIDKDIMRCHAQAVAGWYAGDGWYRDGHAFDYYSPWAFQLYGPLWCIWYGYENEPYLARQFEARSNALMKTYDRMFDEGGWVNMWGRSGIYRNAATAAFAGNLLLRHSEADPGLARRISSGSLIQFLGRDDWMYEGVPVLGFYRPFTPLIQSYSCAESPLWLGKAFLCLCLPPDHPFWTEQEKNGVWEALKAGETKETVLNGPGLVIADHKDNGTTELRTGKVIRRLGDENGLCCYARLSYSTRYPWEAGTSGKAQAQAYMLTETDTGERFLPNAVMWAGERDGVVYRRGFFQYTSQREEHWHYAVDLADFPVSCGLMRADKIRTYRGGYTVSLGSYGFPADSEVECRRLEKDGASAVILKGRDSQGREKQMAMTVFSGWQEIFVEESRGTNPDADKSMVIGASLRRDKMYGYEPFVVISQVITRESWEDFSEDAIFSVKKILFADEECTEENENKAAGNGAGFGRRLKGCGGYGPVRIWMKDGREMTVDYAEMEGRLQI